MPMPAASPTVVVMPDDAAARVAAVRKPTKPSSLAIGHQPEKWTDNHIEVSTSPDCDHATPTSTTANSNPLHASPNSKSVVFSPLRPTHIVGEPGSNTDQLYPSPNHTKASSVPLSSPCFVHSLLDKGVSFADWVRQNPAGSHPNGSGVSSPMPLLSRTGSANGFLHQGSNSESLLGLAGSQVKDNVQAMTTLSSTLVSEDEEEGGDSLTKQLADTAVGVREMSKQLGRVRVKSHIQNVLIVTKARDNNLVKLTRQLALYLMKKHRHGGRGLVVYVDTQLRESKRFDAAGIERDYPELFEPLPRRRSASTTSLTGMSDNGSAKSDKGNYWIKEEGQLRYWTSEMCTRSPHLFDFVVTLGGDGTVLFTSWLFQKIVPPVLPFALGSLGFLTNFDFDDHEKAMDSVIDHGIRVNLRMRFTCTVYRSVHPKQQMTKRRAVKKGATGEIMMKDTGKEGWEALESGYTGHHQGKSGKDKEIACLATRPVETFEVLNDLVVDRGPSPYMSLLELFGDEHHLTTVQADGLVMSTPTGSTAYSLSAGGSLTHPEIPALLITPICPHTLSFRPMLLPDSMELRICVPYNSRSTAWASFDGRGRVELRQGDHIKVTASRFPFPTVCVDEQSSDWFHAISRTLKWNERERQKSFVVVEEGPEKAHKKRSGPEKENDTPKTVPEEDEDGDEEEEDEDAIEEKFDIDDSSGDISAPASTVVSPETLPEPDPMGSYVSNIQLPDSQAHSHSGIETPGRYAGPHPHPPKLHPRHTASRTEERPVREREHDVETMRTPRPEDRMLSPRRTAHGHATRDTSQGRRAFAVWGQDESDSGTSDSDIS